MAKRKRKITDLAEQTPKKAPLSKSAVGMLCALVALTVVVLVVYRFFMTRPFFPTVMLVYTVIAAASTLGYVIYNRGFSRRGVTKEMLPDTWSDEKKENFIADGARRMKRSRPLLIVAFAFCFTFAFEALELFVLPTLLGMLGFGS